tara:strand:+ start:5078 stop:5269 length:192 start_codon:yes stop_codon:yes gene_type:complete
MIGRPTILLNILCFVSCVGRKYNYLFDTNGQLGFGKGKWIFNRTAFNFRIFDREPYKASFERF